jgi:hypothetical protein
MSDTSVGVVLALDTETGGLSAKVNPLLSIALVAADAELQERDFISIKFHPPVGTVIELPIPEHRTPTIRGKKIMGYLDGFTGQQVEDVSTRPIITAVAAEINGYMPIKNGTWDMQFPPEWHREALDYEAGTNQLFAFIAKWFNDRPNVVAHNAKFDNPYTETYLPKFFAVLGAWFCTCDAFRAHNAKTKSGLKANLDTLCKTAGYTQLEIDRAQIHGALPDARGCLAGLRWLKQQAG